MLLTLSSANQIVCFHQYEFAPIDICHGLVQDNAANFELIFNAFSMHSKTRIAPRRHMTSQLP